MPMKPRKDESQTDFMARCMHETFGADAPADRTQEQAVAICMSYWREEHGGSPPKAAEVDRIIARWKRILAKDMEDIDESIVPYPEPDETEEEFIDRCVDEVIQASDVDVDESDAEDICSLHWEERAASKDSVVHKTHSEDVQGMEFVLSDETPDRMGDIITASGWVFENFNKNPIALFNHRADFPIGRWENLRIEGTSLRGRMIMAPAGTSSRIDEIRKLIDAGILRAVSVGFVDIESEPLSKKDPWSGRKFTKQELIETSLVSVPANPNALAVAKSLGISPATIDMVFAGTGERGQVRRRGLTGGIATRKTSNRRSKVMTTLAQRIKDIEAAILDRKDKLAAHLEKLDDSNVSDADLKVSKDLNDEIGRLEEQHETLVASEKLLGDATTRDSNSSNGRATRSLSTVLAPRQTATAPAPARPALIKVHKELDVLDYFVRSALVTYAAKAQGRLADAVRQEIYGDDEGTRVMCEVVLRSASAPALTTVTGWAAELVQQTYTDLMPLLMPKAVLTRLAGRGLTLSFGRYGKINIPTRSRTPTIAGSFVGEGMPIPVRMGAFTSQALTPKKMAVITTWTREMDDHSLPAIEGLLREAIQQDTTVAVDSVLLDSNAATTIRPAGLLNGVAAIGPTAGGGVAAIVGDIKLLVGALTTNLYGNLRNLVLLMNPAELLSASLATAPNTGIFPFKADIAAGNLNGIPFIDSSTVPAKTVILIDAADFVVAGGEAPRMDMSDQATLHMEDTTPLELVGTGSPGTVASPQRSLFQTDSLALRMVMPLNWLQRRAGTLAWTQNVTW